jgi:type II secretory pathway predicted ATPase ExeA
MRLLTNYAMDSENRLTLVLVGHPELRRRMSMAALDALAQRIVVCNLANQSRPRTNRPFMVTSWRLSSAYRLAPIVLVREDEDGEVVIEYQGLRLPTRVFPKDAARIEQGAIVDNKRLHAGADPSGAVRA